MEVLCILSYIKLRVIPVLGSLDAVSDSEEAAGGNEDPGREREIDRESQSFSTLLIKLLRGPFRQNLDHR